jgi:hypothetical protein
MGFNESFNPYKALGGGALSSEAMGNINRNIMQGAWGRSAEVLSQRLGLYTNLSNKSLQSSTMLGKTALSGRKTVLKFANQLNDHLVRQGRGVAAGFQSLGGVMSRMPLKHLAKSYAIGTPMMVGMEVAFMGKPLSFGTVAEAAWHNIPFTIGMELAGGGFKGIAKHMGYQALGEYMGLGPWGSLALQVAGSTSMPGIAGTLALGAAAYEGGKGMYNLHKQMHQLGKGVRKSEFATGDMSFATAEAATMRQRAVGAIQKSHMNMRSMLGREATIMMGR